MNGRAYYNEIDEFAAAWLRGLIAAGHIAPGEVDTRSVVDVRPDDLRNFTQCHFFAGIGGWSYALRLAGWPDDRPVWTGSCPCQPYSQIGLRRGDEDPRNLWPSFRALIAECGPAVVFGEQVASADGRIWLSGVRADLEALGYAVGATDLCAAGVSAPHRRQRIYWLGDAHHSGLEGYAGHGGQGRRENPARPIPATGRSVPWNSFVSIVDRHGNARRCEPGTSPMAARVPSDMGRLRAYGNAVVPQVAAEVIAAWMECRP